MTTGRVVLLLALLVPVLLPPGLAYAQADESRISVLGYFQGSFYYQKDIKSSKRSTSFTTQHLNLLLQKDLLRRWSAFINFEFTNSYSSQRNWGSFSLEEAWAKYRRNKYFSIKMGLLIPRYNNLNEIKNRTPLLPYIIRPLVYETSFRETIPIEEFVPEQAYVQVYGYAPVKGLKFDYAAYWGNSPNINTDPAVSQTGIDTSSTFMFGGRIGVRNEWFKFGLSSTGDDTNRFLGLEPAFGLPEGYFDGVRRIRAGFDLSLNIGDFMFESEGLGVRYEDNEPNLDADMSFFYFTAGYTFWERLLVYLSVWELKTNNTRQRPDESFEIGELKMTIPNFGVAYTLSDRVALKAAIAGGETTSDLEGFVTEEFEFYSLAVSISF
jgi:hypothetical protein